MKFVIVHGHGLAGEPLSDLGGRTPLQAANVPHLDRLATAGELGLVTLPSMHAGFSSDMTQLALLGYDPRKYHLGRGPFEAAGLGVVLGEHDIAYRCSIVTLRAQSAQGGGGQAEVKKLGAQVVMDDAEAGGIETEEARELIDAVNEQLGSESLQFYPGNGARHLMVWVDGKFRAVCTDPGRIVGRPIGEFLPNGDGADMLKQVMEASLFILRDHPVNEERRQGGKKPANCLWLWGQGRPPAMPRLTDRFQVTGAVVSASELHRGIGICAGLDAVSLEMLEQADAPNGRGLVQATLRELEKKDFAYVHGGLLDGATPGQDGKVLVEAAEEFDRAVVGPLVEGLAKSGPYRLLIVCDPPASSSWEPKPETAVPYAIVQGPQSAGGAGTRRFTEADAQAAKALSRDATRLLPKLLARG